MIRCTMASDLQFELEEAFRDLEQLQHDTKLLLTSSSTAKKKRPASKVAQSTWAKSTVRRIGFTEQALQPDSTDVDSVSTTSLPSSLRPQSTPAFSFPKASRSSIVSDSSSAPQYNPNINALSTKQRSRCAVIAPPSTASSIDTAAPPDDQSVTSTITPHVTPSKAYSFGKAPRLTETSPATDTPASTSELHVEHSEKYLCTHVPTAIMRPPPVPRDVPESPNTTLESSSPGATNVEVLSKHFRAPATRIMPDTVKRSKRNTSPGPGSYNPVRAKETIQKGVKFTPVPRDVDSDLVKLKQKPTPGPGDYDVTAADAHTVTHAPAARIIAPTKTSNPYLERKKYFEEKARDLREEHDDGRDANIDVIKPRTTIVKIMDKTVGITDKNKEILSQKRLESEREKQLQYDAKYDLVEKRSRVTVKMEDEVRAKQSVDKIRNRPSVVDARARHAPPELDYLGPQLQAPWVPDEAAPSSDSPTEDILMLLGEKADHHGTTDAYLRSSYVGTIASKPAAIRMVPPKPNEERLLPERKLTFEEMQQQYLSTQVHQPWENNRSDGRWSNYGRDERRILRKGEEEVIRFNEAVIPNRDAMGPGYYEIMGKFGEDVQGVSFGDAAGRDLHDESLHLDEEEVCISPLLAKDKIDKRPKTVKLYVNERHPKPKIIDDGLADHLGGSYFEGMAESIEKKHPVVNFDAMRGRETDEHPLEDVVTEELQLEVKNWKPHKERERIVVFADPKKNPRFVEVKRDEKPIDAPPTPIPNYDYKQKHEPQVDMSRQIGRGLNDDKEVDVIQSEIGEAITAVERKNIAAQAKQLDDILERGEMQQSNKKRVHAPVDMSRHVKDPPPIKSAAPDVVYEVNSDFVKNRQGKGVVAWATQAEDDDASALINELGEASELIVSPHPEQKSSFKRIVTGPAWDRDAIPSRPEAPSLQEEELDLEPNIDYLKPGITVPKPGVAMRHQGGRRSPSLQEVGAADVSEELILEPDLDLRHPKPPSGAAWSKVSQPVSKILIDDQQSGDVLILEKPTENWKKSGRPGFGNSRHNYESKIERKIGDDEELILEPQLRESKQNPQVSWAKEHSLGHPSYLSKGEELILSPAEPAPAKPLPWSKKDEAIDRSSVLTKAEELVLSPQEPPAVVGGSWNKKDDATAGGSILTKPEELILTPQHPKRNQKAPASWKHQGDQDIDRSSMLPVDDELQLTLKEEEPRKNIVSWKNQGSVSDRRSMLPESEALDLTPQDRAIAKNRDSAVRWSVQNSEAGDVIPQSQVLKLSPKVAKRTGDRTVAWKQDTKKPTSDSQTKRNVPTSSVRQKSSGSSTKQNASSSRISKNITENASSRRDKNMKPLSNKAAPLDSLSPVAGVSVPSPASRAPLTPIDDDLDVLDAKLRELELRK